MKSRYSYSVHCLNFTLARRSVKTAIYKAIQSALVDIDKQLNQLAEAQDIRQVKRFIPNISNQLYDLSSICLYGVNIWKFANHQPSDRTPLNPECA